VKELQITAPRGADDPAWLRLRSQLWPQVSEAEHRRDMASALARGHFVRLALGAGGTALGLVEASRRVDYVNGTESSPVGFLEGLFVAAGARRQGIARVLVDSVAAWALAGGCRELAFRFAAGQQRRPRGASCPGLRGDRARGLLSPLPARRMKLRSRACLGEPRDG
jgi:GNAT superfamily N-acetyltransferase